MIAAAAAACATAVPESPYIEVIEGTTRVTCRGPGLEGPFGSRLARSPMLVAPAGGRSAWAEVEAVALEDGGGEGTCQNVSRLFVREGETARVVFTQRPGWEGRSGNALDLIDWSPDGSRLLLELHTWTYPTDPPDPLVLVWDARTRQAEAIDLEALSGGSAPDCAYRLAARGFDDDGWAVIDLLPDDVAENACEGSSRWRVSPMYTTAETAPEATLRRWSAITRAPRLSRD